ncbi:MAG: M10 family metallopeptidase C-terminal domain-containing protein [Candidatus Saccharibacteria bacterium]|nr:M10 family metallopeptidase C-terminal domain-containing protein [Pseudorhodobacter sp.]
MTPPITDPGPVVVADGPSFLDAIDWGSKLASNTVTVYFAGAGEVFDRKTLIGWTGYEVQQAMLAFQQFANVADLQFSITRDATDATLKLVNVQKAGFLGYFNPPGTKDEGVGVFNHTGKGWDFNDDSGGLQQGGYGFITMLHEFGHAMGMAHPHDAGGKSTVWQGVSRATGDLGKFDFNQGIYSTMTYNDGWQTDPDGQNKSGDFGWQGTMMGLDVAVLQQKYGANTTFASGDTQYTLTGTNQSGTYFACIWDTGGTDQITYHGHRNTTIDLRAAHLGYAEGSGGYISNAKGSHSGFTIANGAVIENAIGGQGDDSLTGNEVANTLIGKQGRDILSGMTGDDNLTGGSGADLLQGGAGVDSFTYVKLSDSAASGGRFDHIVDFDSLDVLDLHAMDAARHGVTNDAFIWIDTARFSDTAGEVRWTQRASGVQVLADHDGDGTADFKLVLDGVTGLTLADLVL